MSEIDPTAFWLRIDDVEDVESSLDALDTGLRRAADGRHGAWKWAIVSAHSAITGALTHTLGRHHVTSALRDIDRRAMLEWGIPEPADRGPYPQDLRVAGPGTLIRRAMDAQFMSFGDGRPIALSAREQELLEELDSTRDNLMHFFPHMGWSIPLPEMKDAIRLSAQITGHLMLGHSGVVQRLEDEQKHFLRERLLAVSSALELHGLPAISLAQIG
jgi:hypothetical protein